LGMFCIQDCIIGRQIISESAYYEGGSAH